MVQDANSTKRDWVDYIDIGIKIFGGVVLTIATLYINRINEIEKRNTDLKQQEVTNNLKYGDFTKSLMQELLNKDSTTHLHRDIALIILNSSIGDSDHYHLIGNIGYCLVADYLQNNAKNADQNTIQTVISIVKERDTAKYNAINNLWASYNASQKVIEDNNTIINSTIKKNSDTNIISLISHERLDKLTLLASSPTVFIQINKGDPASRTIASGCLDYLKNCGFTTPGIESITSLKFPNSIKYFYDNDRKPAKVIQQRMYARYGKYIEVQKQYNTKARNGFIELWWNI